MHNRFSKYRLGITKQFLPGPELTAFLRLPVLVDINEFAFEAMQPTDFDPDRDDVAVKINRAIVGKAKMVATHRGISVAELLTDAAQPAVDKAYAQMLRKLEGGPATRKPTSTADLDLNHADEASMDAVSRRAASPLDRPRRDIIRKGKEAGNK